jgi:hypothetical protein
MAPSIGGLGVREASVLYLFSRYLPSERAFALTLLMDIVIYSFSIGSGIWYAFRGGLKQKNPDVYKSTILVPNLAKRMNGAIEYLVPVFALRKSTEIEEKTAKTLWGRLREWEKAKI